jgi:nicotinate-nucleotide pyrophosphorylase
MKVYVQENGITLVGKAWQVRYMLKKYSDQYETIQEWVADSRKTTPHLKLVKK